MLFEKQERAATWHIRQVPSSSIYELFYAGYLMGVRGETVWKFEGRAHWDGIRQGFV